MALRVYKSLIDTTNKNSKKIAKNWMGIPFRVVLCGPTASGKSNIIKNVCFNKDIGYDKVFESYYVWCASLDDLLEYKMLAKQNHMEDIFSFTQVYKDEDVKSLFNSIEQDNINKESDEKENTLMIFDDQIVNGVSNKSKLNALSEIFTRGRHAFVSVIVSTQKYRSLSSVERSLNVSHLFVFEGTNISDLTAIAEEHCGTRTKDEMLRIMKDNLKSKFDFIIINNRDHIIQNKNFQKLF
jgi:septin family protein